MPVHLLRQRPGGWGRRRSRRVGGERRFVSLRSAISRLFFVVVVVAELDVLPPRLMRVGGVGRDRDPRGSRGLGVGRRAGRRQQGFGDGDSFLAREPLEVDHAPALVLDGVSARVLVRAVLHQPPHEVDVVRGHVLGERQLLGENRGHADLARADERVGHDHRARRVVHALAHHVHTEQTLLLLQLLPDADAARVAALGFGAVDQAVHARLQRHERAEHALRAR